MGTWSLWGLRIRAIGRIPGLGFQEGGFGTEGCGVSGLGGRSSARYSYVATLKPYIRTLNSSRHVSWIGRV